MSILSTVKYGIAAVITISIGAMGLPSSAEARGGFHGGRSGGMHMGGGGHHPMVRPRHPGAHPTHHKPPPHAGAHAKPHTPAHHHKPPPRHGAHHKPPPPHHHNGHHDHHHPPRGPYWPGYWHDGDDILRGAVTALAIGSIIRSAPSGCNDVRVNNRLYKHCGNTWLQAAYSGHQLVYVAVDDPR